MGRDSTRRLRRSTREVSERLRQSGGWGPGAALAVVGASGRAGASTLASACAVLAAEAGLAVAAVDLQPGGPGLDALLGVEHRAGVRWADLTDVEGEVDGPALLERLPRCGELAVLAHGRHGAPVPSIAQMGAVVAGLRSGVELLVLDVWRGHTLTPTEVGLLEGDLAVLVAETAPLALAALRASAAGIASVLPDSYLLLRGGPPARALIDDVQDALDLPVLGFLDDDPTAARDVSRGRPPGRQPGPVRERAADLLAAVLPGRVPVAS